MSRRASLLVTLAWAPCHLYVGSLLLTNAVMSSPRHADDEIFNCCNHCCESALVSMQIRIQHFRSMWIRIQIQIQGFEKFTVEIVFFFISKITIYLSLGRHKGRPSYRRSLQPSNVNIQHFKTWNFFTFFSYLGSLVFLDPDPVDLKSMRILIRSIGCEELRFNQCFGSGIRWLFDPGIRNRFFLDPGSQTYIFESLLTIFWPKSSIILRKIGPNFFLHQFKNKIIYNFVTTNKGP